MKKYTYIVFHLRWLISVAAVPVLITACSTRTVRVQPPQSHHLWHDRELKVTTTDSDIFLVANFRFHADALEGDFTIWAERQLDKKPVRRTLLFNEIEGIDLIRPPDPNGYLAAAVVVAAVLTPVFQKGFLLEKRHWSRPGSCPYLYIAGDSGWVRSAEIFSASIAQSLQAEDWIPIPPTAYIRGDTEVLICNELPELHFLDHLVWAVAQHRPHNRVVRDLAGDFWEVGPGVSISTEAIAIHRGIWRQEMELKLPETQWDDLVIEFILKNTWQGEFVLADLVALIEPSQAHWASLVDEEPDRLQRVRRGLRRLALGVSIRGKEGWREIGRIPVVGPSIPRTVTLRLPSRQCATEPSTIRLEWPDGAWIVYSVSVAPILGQAKTINRIPTPYARVSSGASMLEPLSSVDKRYAILSPGDTLNVALPPPTTFSLEESTIFLVANGYYIRASDQTRWPTIRRIVSSILTDPTTAWDYIAAAGLFFAPGG